MTKMTGGVLWCAIATWAAMPVAWAQVHRCVDAAGKVEFSDTACPSNAKQSQRVMGAEATAASQDPDASSRTRMSIERTLAGARSSTEAPTAPSPAPANGVGAIDASRTGQQQVRSAFAPKQEDQSQTESTLRGPVGGSRDANPNWSPSRGYYGGGGPADQRYERERLEIERLKALRDLQPHSGATKP